MPQTLCVSNAFVVLPEEAEHRIDMVLARVLPGWGLRARRRACREGLVHLDGRQVNPACKVRAGQEVRLESRLLAGAQPLAAMPGSDPWVVSQTPDLLLLAKPACLHSVSLSGSPTASLEHWLTSQYALSVPPRLLNRLDYGTSGLVAAALTPCGAQLWAEAEDSRLLDKRYLALVHGCPAGPIRIRCALDTAERRLTRCLPTDTPDPLRHTWLSPLGLVDAATAQALLRAVRPSGSSSSPVLPLSTLSSLSSLSPLSPGVPEPCSGRFSLVGCRIRKGARHQIRAHLAAVGLPLCGDPLYGPDAETGPLAERGGFVLHHGALHLREPRPAGVGGVLDPVWLSLLPDALAESARSWLREPQPDEA